MAKVYSDRLLIGGATASESATVPGDVLWVVRDARFFFDGASSSDIFNLAVITPSSGTAILAYGQAAGGTAEIFEWQGRQVMKAGDRLVFSGSTVNWYVTVSGYVLTLP